MEIDIADFGGKIDPQISGEKNKGPRKQLLMLVAVDVFSKAIFAEALPSKRGPSVVSALKKIFKTARHVPSVIVSDKGEILTARVQNFTPHLTSLSLFQVWNSRTDR